MNNKNKFRMQQSNNNRGSTSTCFNQFQQQQRFTYHLNQHPNLPQGPNNARISPYTNLSTQQYSHFSGSNSIPPFRYGTRNILQANTGLLNQPSTANKQQRNFNQINFENNTNNTYSNRATSFGARNTSKYNGNNNSSQGRFLHQRVITNNLISKNKTLQPSLQKKTALMSINIPNRPIQSDRYANVVISKSVYKAPFTNKHAQTNQNQLELQKKVETESPRVEVEQATATDILNSKASPQLSQIIVANNSMSTRFESFQDYQSCSSSDESERLVINMESESCEKQLENIFKKSIIKVNGILKQKMDEQIKENEVDEGMVTLNVELYYCKVCSILMSEEFHVDEHLVCEVHLSKKKEFRFNLIPVILLIFVIFFA